VAHAIRQQVTKYHDASTVRVSSQSLGVATSLQIVGALVAE
jgi:hypothetical protein